MSSGRGTECRRPRHAASAVRAPIVRARLAGGWSEAAFRPLSAGCGSAGHPQSSPGASSSSVVTGSPTTFRIVALDPPPPAPRRGPGSRSRPPARAIRRWPGTSRSAPRPAPGTRPRCWPPRSAARAVLDQAHPADHRVAAAGQRAQHRSRASLASAGLPYSRAPRLTSVSTPEDQRRRHPRGDGGGLAVGVLERDLVRRARRRAPRRPGTSTANSTPSCSRIARRWGEREARTSALTPTRCDSQPRSGKNSATSRAADSGESEPWTMFWPTSIA